MRVKKERMVGVRFDLKKWVKKGRRERRRTTKRVST